MESPAPTGSSRACSGSLDFGTRNRPAIRAPRITGTFTKKTEPQ